MADKGIEPNSFYNCDCMELFPKLADKSVDLILTDIPYDGVNRATSGIRNFDKGNADIIKFDLDRFLNELYRVCKGTIIIFCGKAQISGIYKFFLEKDGTVRQLIWNKTNPSPVNGEYAYLSGIENAVYFRKPKAVFNAFCKNTVFNFAGGQAIFTRQKRITCFCGN